MKNLRRSLLLFLLALVFLVPFTFGGLNASNALVPLEKVDGSILKYRNKSDQVMVPSTYYQKSTEFRGVWVSPLVSDIARFSSEEQYKKEMNKVFDIMEYYNMNALLYHVRIMNDALYESEFNDWSVYYNTNPSWDALPWLIEEAHRRGIEFHAWMNPYRVVSKGYTGTLEELSKQFPKTNAASNPNNLLISNYGDSKGGVILNPGEPAVRDFLYDTVTELIENYDVDAIHFDDYFYIEGADDQITRNKYNKGNLSIEDFRRLQVDTFIEELHYLIEDHNIQNNKKVQLGISPSGIWRNGSGKVSYDDNGNAETDGSNTLGYAHYGSPLFSDSKKWIDEEWIDYIIPQSYWALEHNSASFADVMDWWVKVVKNKKVNLYSGTGLYLAGGGAYGYDSTFSWYNNPMEMHNQLLFSSQFPEIDGFSIFSFKHIREAYNIATGPNPGSSTNIKYKNMESVKNIMWNNPVPLPQTVLSTPVYPERLRTIKLQDHSDKNIITWNTDDSAKYYAIYRSSSPLNYTQKEIVEIIGNNSINGVQSYTDNTNENYYYGVRPISMSNTIGGGVSISPEGIQDYYFVKFFDKDNNLIKEELVVPGNNAVAPIIRPVQGFNFLGWDVDFKNVSSNLEVRPLYEIKKYNVKFVDMLYMVLKTEVVEYGKPATEPEVPDMLGHYFVKWDKPFDNITSDLTVSAVYEKYTSETDVTVVFKDFNGEILDTKVVKYGSKVTPPELPEVIGYKFIKWDQDLNSISGNLTINPVYEPLQLFTVEFKDSEGNTIKTEEVYEGKSATAPFVQEIEGYNFVGWDTDFTNVTKDLVVTVKYELKKYKVTFLGLDNKILKVETVEHGKSATAPDNKEDGYTFVAWDVMFDNVNSDLIVKSEYEIIVYNIKFVDSNGIEIKTVKVTFKDEIDLPDAPVKKGYKFIGWDHDLSSVRSDLTVTAQYEKLSSSCSLFNFWQVLTVLGVLFGFTLLRKRK